MSPNVVDPLTVSLPEGTSPETLTLIGLAGSSLVDGDRCRLRAEAHRLEPDRHRQRVAPGPMVSGRRARPGPGTRRTWTRYRLSAIQYTGRCW